MARSIPSQQSKKKRATTPSRKKPSKSVSRKHSSKKKKSKQSKNLLRDLILISLECLSVTIIGMVFIIVLLGYFANRFSGTDLLDSLLPFAGAIFGLFVLAYILMSLWKRLRRWLQARSSFLLPPAIMLGLAAIVCGFVPQAHFARTFGYYRTLIGGKEEAARVVLAHQVYAAYRRLNIAPLGEMINRSEQFKKEIEEAAAVYNIDLDLLKGLAAAESSYRPRKSTDGGHGLFQITRVPTSVSADVNKHNLASRRKMNDSRYNAFLGAATLSHYLTKMNGDLCLGLLAYNIGPANGGLRFIMEQYGVSDFSTIQPYLRQLPRDYPIRVLSYALAFRIKRKKGRLLAYEDGKNAMTIQALGLPGL